jgi:hypothetical protein
LTCHEHSTLRRTISLSVVLLTSWLTMSASFGASRLQGCGSAKGRSCQPKNRARCPEAFIRAAGAGQPPFAVFAPCHIFDGVRSFTRHRRTARLVTVELRAAASRLGPRHPVRPLCGGGRAQLWRHADCGGLARLCARGRPEL